MRLWHQKLIPHLDTQRLVGQHRECCALRGNGWNKKHSVVDYVFTHSPSCLVAYHYLIMDEMERRGYHPDPVWRSSIWRGQTLKDDASFADPDITDDQYYYAKHKHGLIYEEHDKAYLNECVENLKTKNAPIYWEIVSTLFND